MKLITNYNKELHRLQGHTSEEIKESLNRNDDFIKWTRKLEQLIVRNRAISFEKDKVQLSLYRLFPKKWLCYQNEIMVQYKFLCK